MWASLRGCSEAIDEEDHWDSFYIDDGSMSCDGVDSGSCLGQEDWGDALDGIRTMEFHVAPLVQIAIPPRKAASLNRLLNSLRVQSMGS